MPLDESKINFIEILSQRSLESDVFEQIEEQKNLLLEQVLEMSDEERELLRTNMTFEVENSEGKIRKSMDKRGQIKSIESTDPGKGWFRKKEERSEDQIKVQAAFDQVVSKLNQLRSATVEITRPGPDGKVIKETVKMFPEKLLRDEFGNTITDPDQEEDEYGNDEIRQELFQPLVDEGLFPETFVSDKYSTTQRLLDNAFREYQESLEKDKDKEKRSLAKEDMNIHGASDTEHYAAARARRLHREFEEALGNALGAGETTQERVANAKKRRQMAMAATKSLRAAGALQGVILGSGGQQGTQSQSQTGATNEEASPTQNLAIVQASVLAARMLLVPTAHLAKDAKALSKNQENTEKAYNKASRSMLLRKAALEIVGQLEDALTAAVSQLNADVGQAVGQAYAAIIDPMQIADLAVKEPPNDRDAQAIIDILAQAFAQALTACAPPGHEETFAKMGQAISGAFRSGARANTLLEHLLVIKKGEKQEEEDLAGLADAFKSLKAPAQAALSSALAINLEQDTNPTGDNPEAVAFQQLLKDEDVSAAVERKVNAKLEQEALEELKQAEQENQDYERELTLVDELGAKAAEGKILKLMAEVQRDRLLLEMASSLAKLIKGGKGVVGVATTAGVEVATQIVPGLKLASLSIQLTVNIIKAVQRVNLWRKFVSTYDLAKKGNSALAPAIQRFVTSKENQVTQATINDALLVAQIAGEATALSGVDMGAGKAIAATAAASRAINKAYWSHHDEKELKAAWKKTRDAINNPKNRVLGLQAFQANTSLAMHAIVWAALETGDPFANQMMSACGLDENTVAGSGSKEAVLKYMHILLKEDNWVEDTEKTLKADWQPKSQELTRANWLITCSRGEKNANPPLAKVDGSAILAALGPVEAHKDLTTVTGEELEKYQGEVDALIKVLKSFQPYGTDGRPHVEMQAIVKTYLGQAETRRTAIAQQKKQPTGDT